MAYRTYIFDVDDKCIEEYISFYAKRTWFEKLFNQKFSVELEYTNSFSSSTYILHPFDSKKEFVNCIHKVLIGGQLIDKYFWHPIFPPKFLSSSEVSDMAEFLLKEWEFMSVNKHPTHEDPFWNFELGNVLNAVKYASDNKKGLLVLTEKPPDKKRANRTIYPKLKKINSH